MRNKEILDFLRDNIFKVVDREDLLKDDLADTMSSTTKRFANMIMADGLINALLFAYSKAKYRGVKEIVGAYTNDKKIQYFEGNKVITKKVWAVLIWITVKILKHGNFIDVNTDDVDAYKPLRILKTIENNASRAMVGYLLRHLDMLARIFDSYSQ